LFVFLVAPLVVTRPQTAAKRIESLTVAALVALVLIGPWALYNTSRFEDPVLISTGAGTAMRLANCDASYSGTNIGYWCKNESRDANDLFGTDGPVRGRDESERDAAHRREAIDYVRDHGSRLPAVLLAREGRTWSLFRPFQQVHLDARWSIPTWTLRAGLFMYWVLLPASVVGAVLLRRRGGSLLPFLAPIAIVVLTVAITFGQTRYRAAAEVPIVILAAVAFDEVWARYRRRRAISS
jgi:hypothetical protein